MNKWIYLGMLLLLISLGSTSYISATAQSNPPEPTTVQWYIKEGDAFSWYVTKFRENENVTSTDYFYNYTTGESINVTEGDIITITVLTLGNASEYEGTCQIQNGEQSLITRLSDVVFITYPWIIPVYDRDYWVEYVAWNENQIGILDNYNLEGNLLTMNATSTNLSIEIVVDISTGLTHSFHFLSLFQPFELKVDLMTGFPNISFPTLLLTGVIGGEIIVAIYLVRFFRRRRAELS